jgi:RecB family endonuclease NucS
MKVNQKAKPFTVLSDNPKMDTSGMAGKPKKYEPIEWKPPVMTIDDIMEEHEKKTSKKTEMDD